MASLLGKADATLVAAAFREGQSRVGADLSDVYAKREENLATFTKGVGDIFNKIYADDILTRDLLKENASIAETNMANAGFDSEYMLRKNHEIALGWKSRLEDINREFGAAGGKGDLERSLLRGEMNKYLATTQGNNETFGKLMSQSANNELLAKAGSLEQGLLNAMAEDFNNGTSFTNPTYEKGDMVYTHPDFPDVKMTMSELNRKLSVKDVKPLNDIQGILNDALKQGKTSEIPWNVDDYTNRISKTLVNMNDIDNALGERFGDMKYTIKQAMTGLTPEGYANPIMADIYDSLVAQGGIELDGIEGIDEKDMEILKDYATSENGFKVSQALMEDESKLREVVSNVLANNVAFDFFEDGGLDKKKKIITSDDKKKTGGHGGWGAYDWRTKGTEGQESKHITWIQAEKRRGDLDNTRDVGGAHGYYKWDANLGENGMYVDENDNKFTMYQVADREGLIKRGESAGTFDVAQVGEKTQDQKYANEGLAISSMLWDVGGDDDASDKLNAQFGFETFRSNPWSTRKSKYFFMPYSSSGKKKGMRELSDLDVKLADAIGTDDIMLVDRRTGRAVKEGGEIVRIGTGENYNEGDLTWLNNFLKDYAKRRDINTEFED